MEETSVIQGQDVKQDSAGRVTPVALPDGRVVNIPTERWSLEAWTGAPDPPTLPRIWSTKPSFAVNGHRSCAELAIIEHLRGDGWRGAWVNAYARELRTDWFPAPAARRLADVGAPAWAVARFGRLRGANGGRLGGFFDVFAWKEPGQVRFLEAKVGKDKLRDSQRTFLSRALLFHEPRDFTIIEVGHPQPGGRAAQ